MLPKEFSERIQQIRKENNLTQKKLGKILGLSFYAINDIECRKRGTSLENAIFLSNYFNISLDWLVGRTENKISHLQTDKNNIDMKISPTPVYCSQCKETVVGMFDVYAEGNGITWNENLHEYETKKCDDGEEEVITCKCKLCHSTKIKSNY